MKPVRVCTIFLALGSFVLDTGVTAQSGAPDGPWVGEARCVLSFRDVTTTYSHQETHTWTLTSSTPTSTDGAFKVYAATWSVVSAGNYTVQNEATATTVAATWNATVRDVSAPIGIGIRASDGRLMIMARHAQLRAPGTGIGTIIETVNGSPRPTTSFTFEVAEWAFPTILEDPANTTVSGTPAPTNLSGRIAPRQTADAVGTAACNWHFVRAGTATSPPPPLGSSLGRGGQPTTPTAGATRGTPQMPPARVVPPTSTAVVAGVLPAPPLVPPTSTQTVFTAPPLVPPPTMAIVPTQVRHQTQEFTETGVWTVPEGVTQIGVELWGAGAAGHSGSSTPDYSRPSAGGQGGGGGAYTRATMTVVPGTVLAVVIGVGGSTGLGSTGTTDGTHTLLRTQSVVLLRAAGGLFSGSGGALPEDLSNKVAYAGNPGAPGVNPGRQPGILRQYGGGGGAGGTAIAGSVTPSFGRGAGGRGGTGKGIVCTSFNADGFGIDCRSVDSPTPGDPGGWGYAIISW